MPDTTSDKKPIAIYKDDGEPWTKEECELIVRAHGMKNQIDQSDWGFLHPDVKYIYEDNIGIIALWGNQYILTDDYDVISFEDLLHLPGSDTELSYVFTDEPILEGSVVLCDDDYGNQFTKDTLFVTRHTEPESRDLYIARDYRGSDTNGWNRDRFKQILTRPGDTAIPGDRVICIHDTGSLYAGDMFTVRFVYPTSNSIGQIFMNTLFSDFSSDRNNNWDSNYFRVIEYSDTESDADIIAAPEPMARVRYNTGKRYDSIFYKS